MAGEILATAMARLARAGIRIGPHTATPVWRGERLDVDWVVSVLWWPRPDAGTLPGALRADEAPASGVATGAQGVSAGALRR